MIRLSSTLAPLTLMVALTACAPQKAPRSVPLEDADATTVEVTNHNWSTMTVYALRGGERIRLGTVHSMKDARFRIPAHLVRTNVGLRLLADPLGATGTYTTPSFTVMRGQVVDFTIENHLPISNVAVWNP